MPYSSFPTKRILTRIILILLISMVFGLLYNQFHPNGLHWRYLFNFTAYNQDLVGSHYVVISADSAMVLMEVKNLNIIDTRLAEDYSLDHIIGSVHVPLQYFLTGQFVKKLPEQGSSVLLYDENGDLDMLKFTFSLLSEQGYKEVYFLYGGYFSWLAKGFPIE